MVVCQPSQGVVHHPGAHLRKGEKGEYGRGRGGRNCSLGQLQLMHMAVQVTPNVKHDDAWCMEKTGTELSEKMQLVCPQIVAICALCASQVDLSLCGAVHVVW